MEKSITFINAINMKISKEGLELIKGFEKFMAKPYIDAVGVPTIGYGNTYYLDGRKVDMRDSPITEGQATVLLETIFEKDFAKFIPQNVNQNQFDAMASLVYNIGTGAFFKSTLRKKVKVNPNDASIEQEFLKWNKGRIGGQLVELRGLTIRRKKESELYFKPVI
jgi:lysozyme